MADVIVSAQPQFITSPFVKIGAGGSSVEFEVAATNIDVAVNQDENKVETFGGVYTSYKAEQWIISCTVAMSYGATGIWNNLRPLCGSVQPVEVRPNSGAVATTNPKFTGNVYLKAFPFVSAGPGAATECDIVMALQGAPTIAYS
jgi:hypothetical protein